MLNKRPRLDKNASFFVLTRKDAGDPFGAFGGNVG